VDRALVWTAPLWGALKQVWLCKYDSISSASPYLPFKNFPSESGTSSSKLRSLVTYSNHVKRHKEASREDYRGCNVTVYPRRPVAGGRRSIKNKAVSQQYLMPQEKAVVEYALHNSSKGWPVTVNLLRSLALVICRHCDSSFQIPSDCVGLPLPGRYWPQSLYKRHPERKALKVKTLVREKTWTTHS